MATYLAHSLLYPLAVKPEPLCDEHSEFDAEGFALPNSGPERRCWAPVWGGPCSQCGADC